MKIPTNPMYDIDECGIVRLISTGSIIPEYRNRHGRRAVKIRGKSHKPSSHPLDRLMLLTYKSLPSGKDPEWLSIMFKDGNRDNIDIENIEWDETYYQPDPKWGMEIGYTVWHKIPGYSDIEIRLHDHRALIRRTSNIAEIGYIIDRDGYQQIAIPGINRHVGLHRLMALTFLPHPLDTDLLTVNHKDSVKDHNVLSNLEWCSYASNNFHSYEEGPRGDTVRNIVIRNLSTGEEKTFVGYNDAARYLGVAPGSVHSVMERRKYEGRPYLEYVLKYADDDRSWDDLRASGPISRRDYNVPVARHNFDTGETIYHSNVREVMEEVGITDHALFRLMESDVIRPWKRQGFRRGASNSSFTWPKYPERILQIYDELHATDRPIKVIDAHGSVEYASSVTQWCNADRENRCDPAVLSRLMKRSKNKGTTCQWRNWVFAHVDLKCQVF